ncbi:hypothetical protein PP460_gp063 [Streptomyces phage Muntaha]|uniref:Uncharacterized protein n=1 Tax=Streptomyces phage Muntaha TaxID=2713269 RepID=A0A6G8R3G5_9CAUD|nr:hypothetical protein PP460_gp063 [Streptomyces phage Muntaha]QIN94739.1 hypothetical protein SEA_MUNTAHA_215 [Streptomyces phage Muntaha]
MPGYKISYAFVFVYSFLAILNLCLTNWSIAITDVLVAILFLRVGMYEKAIKEGTLVRPSSYGVITFKE